MVIAPSLDSISEYRWFVFKWHVSHWTHEGDHYPRPASAYRQVCAPSTKRGDFRNRSRPTSCRAQGYYPRRDYRKTVSETEIVVSSPGVNRFHCIHFRRKRCPVIYFDSTYIIKCYVAEPGTAQVLALAQSHPGRACALHGRLEFWSGIRRHVREGNLLAHQAEAAFRNLSSTKPLTSGCSSQYLGHW